MEKVKKRIKYQFQALKDMQELMELNNLSKIQISLEATCDDGQIIVNAIKYKEWSITGLLLMSQPADSNGNWDGELSDYREKIFDIILFLSEPLDADGETGDCCFKLKDIKEYLSKN